jgi:hypothetical protein
MGFPKFNDKQRNETLLSDLDHAVLTSI